MDKIVITKILEFSDVYSDYDKFNVRQVLCRYDKLSLLRIVNVLGVAYGNAIYPDTAFFSDSTSRDVRKTLKHINNYLKKVGRNKIYYSTMRSILELLRYVYSIPNDEYKNEADYSDLEYDVFRVLLYINERLMKYSSSDELSLARLLYSVWYIENDISIQETSLLMKQQYAYFQELVSFLKANPAANEIKKAFLNKYDLSSFEQYGKNLMAIILLYYKVQKDNINGCPILDLDLLKDETGFLNKKLTKALSISVDDYFPYDEADSKEPVNVDYRQFRSKPLINIGDNKYIIYSLPLLCERVYNSMFFDLKEVSEMNFGTFTNFYNTDFVERFLFQRTMFKGLSHRDSKFFPCKSLVFGSEKIKEDKDQPDFYIREGSNIFLFECKAIKLNGVLKDNANMDDFFKALSNKLFCSDVNLDSARHKKKKAETVGVTQLMKEIEMIEDDMFQWDDKIPDCVEYYPVLVLEDPKLSQVGITGVINECFNPLKKKHFPEQNVNPIIVMSIYTLMNYHRAFKHFGYSFIFRKFWEESATFAEGHNDWTINSASCFDNYMSSHYASYGTLNPFSNYLTNKLCKK